MNAGDRESRDRLVARIREALVHDPAIGELELDVELHEDRVVVSGTVPAPEREQAIVARLRELLPDHRVESRLASGPFPEPGRAERLQ